jgi:hypothetical protein
MTQPGRTNQAGRHDEEPADGLPGGEAAGAHEVEGDEGARLSEAGPAVDGEGARGGRGGVSGAEEGGDDGVGRESLKVRSRWWTPCEVKADAS